MDDVVHVNGNQVYLQRYFERQDFQTLLSYTPGKQKLYRSWCVKNMLRICEKNRYKSLIWISRKCVCVFWLSYPSVDIRNQDIDWKQLENGNNYDGSIVVIHGLYPISSQYCKAILNSLAFTWNWMISWNFFINSLNFSLVSLLEHRSEFNFPNCSSISYTKSEIIRQNPIVNIMAVVYVSVDAKDAIAWMIIPLAYPHGVFESNGYLMKNFSRLLKVWMKIMENNSKIIYRVGYISWRDSLEYSVDMYL